MSKASRYPFSIVYKTLSHEVHLHSQSVLTTFVYCTTALTGFIHPVLDWFQPEKSAPSPTPTATTMKQSTTLTRTEQGEGEEIVEPEEEELSPLEQHIKEAEVIR